jgi:hypothetical protein
MQLSSRNGENNQGYQFRGCSVSGEKLSASLHILHDTSRTYQGME